MCCSVITFMIYNFLSILLLSIGIMMSRYVISKSSKSTETSETIMLQSEQSMDNAVSSEGNEANSILQSRIIEHITNNSKLLKHYLIIFQYYILRLKGLI